MHTVEPWRTAVTLFRDDGECWAYRSMSEALRVLGSSFIRHHVEREFRTYLGGREARVFIKNGGTHTVQSAPRYHCARYVLRDDFGQPLTIDDFGVDAQRRRIHARFRSFWNGEGPVPHTGRHGPYRWLRRPRTYQEIRINAGAVQEEGEPLARICRTGRHLPQAWDDLNRCCLRSWKDHRRHQWEKRT